MSENSKFIENSWRQKPFKTRKQSSMNQEKYTYMNKMRNLTKIVKRTNQKFWS